MATQTPAYLSDSVGTGLIESLARPGGNATGFTAYEYSLAGNWLQTLKEIVRTGIQRHGQRCASMAASMSAMLRTGAGVHPAKIGRSECQ